MTDVLDKIDASLEEVEEQLLAELHRLRADAARERHVQVDPGVANALSEVVDDLYAELQNSGRQELSLLTERHDVLYSRIAVLRHIARAHVPVTYLARAEDGVAERRRALEDRVLARRRKQDPEVSRATEARKGGFLSSLRGLFDHRPSEQEIERNAIKVTKQEENQLGEEQAYLDNGIFSASRELAMIVSLMRGGTLDKPPEEEEDTTDAPRPAAGRAIFESRDLSTRPSQSGEAPRPRPRPAPLPEMADREIAQSPEEIRRKLEARRGQAAGKASFETRDLSTPVAPQDPPRRRTVDTPEKETAQTPPSGKAIFHSRDINPVAPSDPPRRRDDSAKKKAEDEKEEEKSKPGPAVFESRELSRSPFPKKD